MPISYRQAQITDQLPAGLFLEESGKKYLLPQETLEDLGLGEC